MFHDPQKDNNQAENTTSRRRFLKQGSLAAAFAAVASTFGLTPFSPALAATNSSQGTPQITQLTGSVAQGYIDQVLTSSDYQRFQQQVQHDYAGVLTIQEHATTAQSIVDNQSRWVVVRVPIAGGEGHSYYAALFQEGSSTIVQTQSGLLTLTREQNIAAIMEKNGVVVANAVITPKGEFVQGKIYKPDSTSVVLDGLTPQQAVLKVMPALSQGACCLLNGLIVFGLLDVAACVVLALVCAAPCAVTFGGACAVCIAAGAGLTGATIGFVVADCQRNPLAFGGFFGCP